MIYKGYIFNIKIGGASISGDSEYILIQPNSTIEFSKKIQGNNGIYYFEITDKYTNPRVNLLLNDVVLFAYENGMSGKIIGILIDTQNMTLKVFDENVLLNQYPISENSSLTLLSKSSQVTSNVYIYFDNFKYNSFPEAKKLFLEPVNKTLILHDGTHKKYGSIITPIVGENLIPTLISNSSALGEAIGSSVASTSGFEFYKAFTRNIGDSWTSANTAFPHFIGFKFNGKTKVDSYKLISRSLNENDLAVMVKDWTFEGSDNGTNWTVLDTQSNQIWTQKRQSKEFVLKAQVEYQYYRILATANNGYTNTQVSIGGIELYNNVVINNRWSTVSSTLPTKDQFLTDGMDSLSPLLDRRVEALEPLPMAIKSDILQTGEVGKVFSKTIDLKKYLDLRSIEVEAR